MTARRTTNSGQILNAYGLTVVRFANREVMMNIEGVCEKIQGMANPDFSNP